jgi:hypothetical protein
MQISDDLKAELVKLLQSLADKTQSRAEHARVTEVLKQLTDTPTSEIDYHATPYI